MPNEKVWTFEEVSELYKRLNPDALDGDGRVILVAEDQPRMRSLIVKALEKQGFDVCPAETGLVALKLIKGKMPDLCLLDINLPQVSGLDILEAMRNDSRYANIPVIIVTARREKRDIILANKYGAAGYILKPFEMGDLLKKVGEVLKA